MRPNLRPKPDLRPKAIFLLFHTDHYWANAMHWLHSLSHTVSSTSPTGQLATYDVEIRKDTIILSHKLVCLWAYQQMFHGPVPASSWKVGQILGFDFYTLLISCSPVSKMSMIIPARKMLLFFPLHMMAKPRHRWTNLIPYTYCTVQQSTGGHYEWNVHAWTAFLG